DLTETVLQLRASGVRDLTAFPWFEAPQPTALEHAEALLRQLGATGPDGAVTALGRRMLRLPLHPRLGRIGCEAEARGGAGARGVAEDGCAVAALLGERASARPRGGGSARSDLQVEPGQLPGSIERAQRQLARLCDTRTRPTLSEADALLISVLAGFPDRVAR